MVVTDPSIDPITGLPVLNPSGPVQQIPLGQEVFPYADLNATAQPTRGPIYGDDIVPTSSLITAPDAQMKPRSVQATTTRELRVREAVFQSLGKSIPDGTTAPVDVNVIGGGGGGSAPYDQLFNGANSIPSDGDGHSLCAQDTSIKTLHAIQWSLCLAGPGPIEALNQVILQIKAIPSGITTDALFAVVYPDSAPAGYQMQAQWNGFLSFPNGGFKLDFQLPTDGQFQFQGRNSIGTDVWMYIVVYASTT